VAKTGINLAEMFLAQQKKREDSGAISDEKNTVPQQTTGRQPKPVEKAYQPKAAAVRNINAIGAGKNVSVILAELSESVQPISPEKLNEVIEGVYSRVIETSEEKMISFRGSKMLDDFFLQLQASLKSHTNKKVSKEKIMDLILQIVMRDQNYRQNIIGGVLTHLINNK
jgi:hypothetical protein